MIREFVKMEKSDFHALLKYSRKKGLSPKEIHEDMVCVLGKSALFYQVVKNMSRAFKLGRQTCEHAKGFGRPVSVASQEQVTRVHDKVMADRRWVAEINLYCM